VRDSISSLASTVKFLGNLPAQGRPERGVLRHRGWQALKVSSPVEKSMMSLPLKSKSSEAVVDSRYIIGIDWAQRTPYGVQPTENPPILFLSPHTILRSHSW
jgi:D-hexose-6-phosphate mutarotase